MIRLPFFNLKRKRKKGKKIRKREGKIYIFKIYHFILFIYLSIYSFIYFYMLTFSYFMFLIFCCFSSNIPRPRYTCREKGKASVILSSICFLEYRINTDSERIQTIVATIIMIWGNFSKIILTPSLLAFSHSL